MLGIFRINEYICKKFIYARFITNGTIPNKIRMDSAVGC